MKLKEVRDKAVNEFYPEEEELQKAEDLFNDIQEYIREEFDRESHFAGSASRGTCLKGDKDIDVFVLFSEEEGREKIEQEGLEIGKSVFEEFDGEYHVEFAEHPYTKGEIDRREVEIVPCFDVGPKNLRSSVDRTPHHTRWSKENLTEAQKKDVVVLKAFLDAQGLYGSSLKTRGFSGYLCEVLINQYGSFENLVKKAPEWEEETTIAPVETEKEFESGFVVVDPVDPERNVAAVLSEENYAKFIYSCWELREDPDYSAFSKDKEFDRFKLKKELEKRHDLIVLEFGRPDRVDDIVYPQLRKLKNLLQKKMDKKDFRTYSSGVYADEDRCKVFFEASSLPGVRKVKGPKVFHNSRHLKQFNSKYSNVFVEDNRLCAKIDREFTEPREFIKDFLDGDSEKLKERGVPNFLAPEVENLKFADPMEGEGKWLKYLYNELNCD